MFLDATPSPPDVSVGDVILYLQTGIEHSGIVIRLEDRPPAQMWVLSKFGELGEYVHPYREVPEVYGHTIEIWTDRTVSNV